MKTRVTLALFRSIVPSYPLLCSSCRAGYELEMSEHVPSTVLLRRAPSKARFYLIQYQHVFEISALCRWNRDGVIIVSNMTVQGHTSLSDLAYSSADLAPRA